MWILQSSDMVEFRPILGVTSRSTVLETKQTPSSFKFVWRTQNGGKIKFWTCLDKLMWICVGYSSFVAMPRISISRVLDHNFKTKTTLDSNNNRPFPFLRTLQVFYEDFMKFGCGQILHYFDPYQDLQYTKLNGFRNLPNSHDAR